MDTYEAVTCRINLGIITELQTHPWITVLFKKLAVAHLVKYSECSDGKDFELYSRGARVESRATYRLYRLESLRGSPQLLQENGGIP
jgi:hypothetical protein